jgi:hypothetical protein
VVHVNLWWTKWQWDRFFSEFFGPLTNNIPPEVHIHPCIIWRLHNRCISGYCFTVPCPILRHHGTYMACSHLFLYILLQPDSSGLKWLPKIYVITWALMTATVISNCDAEKLLHSPQPFKPIHCAEHGRLSASQAAIQSSQRVH